LLLLQAALPHMKEGSSIINTSSVTAYKGSPSLIDYSSTKGAQVRRAKLLHQKAVAFYLDKGGRQLGAGDATDIDGVSKLAHMAVGSACHAATVQRLRQRCMQPAT
jgi:hypothetical protein